MKHFMISFSLILACSLLTSCSESQRVVERPSSQVKGEAATIHVAATGPESTKSDMWTYIINNAHRTADEYAIKHNPRAVFVGPNSEVDFIKQYGGEFDGRYLLKILNRHGDNTSFIMLLPLFDENASSENLDDEGQLWRVVLAKHNGRDF